MRERARSSRSSPSTIRYPEPSLVTGNDEYSPSGTPYSPRESTAALVPSVPATLSRRCEIAAFAAAAADDYPRTEMISAPRFATRGTNSSSSQVAAASAPPSRSASTSRAGRPATVAWSTSGNWVAE